MVRISAFTCMLVVSAAAAHADQWSPPRVVDLARASAAQISPDGSRIIYALSRPRGTDEPLGPAHANLWLVPFEGGEPRRLTSFDAEDKAPAWSPDGTRVAFLSARGEGGKTRVWILPIDGGEAEAVTPEEVDVLAFAWAPHGRSLAYAAADPKPEARRKAEKEGRDWTVADEDPAPRRLWILPIGAGAQRPPQPVAAAGDRCVWEFDWSPQGDALVATVSETARTDDSYVGKRVLILPVGEGEAREMAGVSGKVDQVAWSSDGRTIALRAAARPDDSFSGSVMLIPASGGERVNVTGSRPESVNQIAWLQDGRLAIVAVRGVHTALSVLKVSDPTHVVDLVEAGGPVVFTAASIARDGTRYAVAGSTRVDPPEVYAGPARRRGDPTLVRLTRSNLALDALPRARQEVFGFDASDGLRLEGILVRPLAGARGTAPLIVVAHGGPESQFLDGWNTGYGAPAQTFAERGWFVFFPNYRGSTGRGVNFAAADHRDLGGREMQDVIDGVDALLRAFPIDRARVGITGGSYGGYFTALAVTRHSDRFAAGAAFYGITHWDSFMGVTDIPVENAQVHWALWCYEHAGTCREASPIAHIATAHTPTLILHGEKDERVPKSQSDELYAALRWKKVPVEYVVFPREKHGLRERAHQIEAMERVLRWFDTHLGH